VAKCATLTDIHPHTLILNCCRCLAWTVLSGFSSNHWCWLWIFVIMSRLWRALMRQTIDWCYFNTCTMHLLLLCKCTIISLIITLLHVSTLIVSSLPSYTSIFISVINQLDAQNFCFTISLFHASTCFEHMRSSSGGQNCIIQPLCNAILTSSWWAHVLETCRGMK